MENRGDYHFQISMSKDKKNKSVRCGERVLIVKQEEKQERTLRYKQKNNRQEEGIEEGPNESNIKHEITVDSKKGGAFVENNLKKNEIYFLYEDYE